MTKQKILPPPPPPPPPPMPWHRLFGFILDDVLHRLLHVHCEVKLEPRAIKRMGDTGVNQFSNR